MDGAPPPEEDFSLLSIEERLAHKNWKARVSAYETLVKTFQVTASDNDPAFRPFLSNPDSLKKIVTDSNAVAQERGLECVVAFVKNAGENAARTRDVVVPALVDKCLGSTRAGTKNQAVELALQYIEVDNGGAGVVVCRVQLPSVLTLADCNSDRLTSFLVWELSSLRQSLDALLYSRRQFGMYFSSDIRHLSDHNLVRSLFGTQVVLPQPILKILPKIFGHTDKTVRAEGTLLTQALYQYIGPALDSFLADLKPVQVKELKESFEALEGEGRGRGTLKPERLTRAHARELEAAGEADEGESEGEPFEGMLTTLLYRDQYTKSSFTEAPVDPRAFAEEVDVMPKFPNDYQILLSSSKWKDRKEALDAILDVLKASMRIQSAPPLGDLARQWAVMIQKDANIMCVMGAAGCIEALAKGLSNHFGRAKDVVPPMLERLKERKANVTDTIGVALDAVFATVSAHGQGFRISE
jgi:cytoskeleton-associated protein 5